MDRPVDLEDVASEVASVMYGIRVLINLRTGEVVPYNADWETEPDERARFQGEEWVEVPYPEEDFDGRAMLDFAHAQDDRRTRERLAGALNRSHSFRRFRDERDRLGLRDAWYAFYEEAAREAVRSWLELEGIPFTEGRPSTA